MSVLETTASVTLALRAGLQTKPRRRRRISAVALTAYFARGNELVLGVGRSSRL